MENFPGVRKKKPRDLVQSNLHYEPNKGYTKSSLVTTRGYNSDLQDDINLGKYYGKNNVEKIPTIRGYCSRVRTTVTELKI